MSVNNFNSKRLLLQSSVYIAYFLSHEGPAGLCTILKKEGLCTSMKLNYVSSGGISFFNISCDLNVDSTEYHIDRIIHLIFQVSTKRSFLSE